MHLIERAQLCCLLHTACEGKAAHIESLHACSCKDRTPTESQCFHCCLWRPSQNAEWGPCEAITGLMRTCIEDAPSEPSRQHLAEQAHAGALQNHSRLHSHRGLHLIVILYEKQELPQFNIFS